MGSVSRIQTDCTNNTAIIAATANTGYCFVQWNDADTNNPRTVTVTQDTAFTAIFDVETGIADIEASIISLYPNPATDNINIVLPENVPSALFMLCDMQGRILLLREIGNREEITVTAAAGVYLYNIVTNRQNFRGKLIIGR
jgi:hypothetical protein